MNRKYMMIIGLVAVGVATYIFAMGFNKDAPEEQVVQDMKQLVHNYSIGNLQAKSASINSHQLIVTETNLKKLTYDLPKDDFFVSIAPFIENTHPCAIHNLVSCQGELVEEPFDVYIEDTEGNAILDQTIHSMPNGFIDLWLPRDKTYLVTIDYNGKRAESEISTFENDNTCITTLQLI